MISPAMRLKFLTLATKYGVEVEHFTHGHAVIRIATWKQYENKFLQLIEDLKEEPSIITISSNMGRLDIRYDPNALEDKVTIDRLLSILERYSF